MRNSTFTPRQNTFARKVMSITIKVMIFGVLLSLFLYACIGADTPNEVAYADATGGSAKGTYGNSGELEDTNFAGGYPGTTIGGVWNHTESITSVTLNSTNVTYALRKSVRDMTIASRSDGNGFTFTKTDNERYGDTDGFQLYAVVNYQVSPFFRTLISNNTATVQVTGFSGTFNRVGGDTLGVKVTNETALKNASDFKDKAYESFTTSSSDPWSFSINPSLELSSNSQYIALAFVVEGASGTDQKNVYGEVYNMKLTFKVTLNDSTKPSISVKENKLTITDGGVGIKSVEIRRNSDGVKIAEFTSSTTWGGALTANTTTHRVTNPDFSDDTKTFTCDIAEANKYDIIVIDHKNNTLDTTFDVNATDLILVSTETGQSITIKGAITRAYSQYNTTWAGLTVPTKLKSVGEGEYEADDSGASISSIIKYTGYGIVGWNGDTPSNVTGTIADGIDATFVPTAIKEVTLYISWEQMFTLIYNSNNGNDGCVMSMALEGSSMTQEIIPDSILSDGVYRPNSSDWAEFYKAGYYLSGWVDGNGSAISFPYTAGTKGTSVDIYAVWTPIAFSVEYNVNGGAGSIPTQTGLTVEDTLVAPDLTSNFDQIADNFFMYWSVMVSGENFEFGKGEYFEEENIKKLLSVGQNNVKNGTSQTITLTANWTGALEFGKRADGTGAWGSETNPYVIRNATHLNNLAALVNASSTSNGGVNSGKLGSYVGSPYATYTGANAEIAVYEKTDNSGTKHYYSYAGAYFVLEVNNLSRTTTIGGGAKKFAGNFDGNGNTISFKYDAEDSYIGVFAYIYAGGHVHHLNVAANITKGAYQIGGVAGRNDGTVSYCNVSGTVKSSLVNNNDKQVGGIVGYNRGTVKGCHNSANVSGDNVVGGIVGYNNKDTEVPVAVVKNCYNTGTVSGTASTGGIVGKNIGEIYYCVNNGTVNSSTTTNYGAIVGNNTKTASLEKSGTIEYVYDFKVNRQAVGGNNAQNNVIAWTFTSEKTGKADTGFYVNLDSSIAGTNYANVKPMLADGTKLNEEDKQFTWADITKNNFTGFYIEDILLNGDQMLSLLSKGSYATPSNISTTQDTSTGAAEIDIDYKNVATLTADLTITKVTLEFGYDWTKSEYQWGSEQNPYIISTPKHLDNFASLVNGTMTAVGSIANIGVSYQTKPVATSNDYANAYFVLAVNNLSKNTPIGGETKPFAGNFNGQGNTITLDISGTGNYVGLFSYISENGCVENLYVAGSVSGGTRVGAVAGMSDGTIANCTNLATVNGSTKWIGGIVGYNRGIVDGCSNSENVTGVDYTGGIVGYNNEDANVKGTATVKNCINSANVDGSGSVGGIIGHNLGLVQYCVNEGELSGSSRVGAIVGNYESGDIEYVFDLIAKWKIIGENIANKDIKGWTFVDSTKNGTDKDGYYVVNLIGEEIRPASADGRADDWADIVSNDFTGFYVGGFDVANGKYLSIKASVTPSNISTTPNNSTGVLAITYVEYSNLANVNGDMVLSFEDIVDSIYGTTSEITTTFDGTDKADFNIINLAQGYTSSKTIVQGTDTINASASPIKLVVNVTNGSAVYGVKLYSITINRLDLSSDNVKVFYSGKTYGAIKLNVDVNGTSTSLYDVTKASIIDYSDASANGGTFYIAVKTVDGYRALYSFTYDTTTTTTGSIIAVNGITPNGTISASHVNTYDAQEKLGDDSSTSFSGTSNYTGTRRVEYALLGSDFGHLSSASDDEWGTSTNPYVISHWTHLVRLSEIVNGISSPIDSVKNMGIDPTDIVAKDIFFTTWVNDFGVHTSHFVVQGNIILPEGITFLPIGGTTLKSSVLIDGSPVSLSYFGGNFDGTNNSQSSTINLGSALENYTGDYSGLFGLVKGNTVAGEIYKVEIKNVVVSAITISGGNYVGALIGKAEKYVVIRNTAEYINSANVTGDNYVGGLVGSVGLCVEIYGRYTNSGQVTATGNYIGGLIGQLVAGAGSKVVDSANIYLFGTGLNFVNNGKIMALSNETEHGNQVGGVIGGTVVNSGDYSAVETIINFNYMQNYASVAGTNFVGGFIGEVSNNVSLYVTNNSNPNGLNANGDTWSHNGSLTSNGDNTISGTANYIGGIVGKLSAMGHNLVGVFNTMPVVGSANSSAVGGIVGRMDNGTISSSFVTIPGTDSVTPTESLVIGGTDVGGIVGYLSGGTVENSYTQGFNYSTVNLNRGGVAGVAQAVATIRNTWALYITGTEDSVTHQTTASNAYGKYILSYSGHSTATIGEMLVFAGLINSTALANATEQISASDVVGAEKGKISLGLTLPVAYESNKDNAQAKEQLTFYDASGYESPFESPFDGAGNNTGTVSMLYIRLNTNAESSLIIAATTVHFGTISDYDGKEEWQNAYSNIGDEQLYVLEMLNGYIYEVNANGDKTIIGGSAVTNSSSQYEPNYRTQYGYDFYADNREDPNNPESAQVINYVYTSREISKVYGKESDVAPLIISSVTDWNNFVDRIKGQNGKTQDSFKGKTVKLAKDIVVTTMAGIHGNETKCFQGTFDGDGHTITINIDANYAVGTSLFPFARDATFKNLTIDGTITKAGLETAGFVGRARGPLVFENCTNSVDIIGEAYSVGGFIGSTMFAYSNGYSYKFYGCVNEGNISVYKQVGQVAFNTYDGVKGLLENPMLRASEFNGVGGFIGTVYNGTILVTYNDVKNNDSISNKENANMTIAQNDNGGEPVYGYASSAATIYPTKDSDGKDVEKNGQVVYPPFQTKPVVEMQSCRNTGSILGSYNVGGLVGYNGGSTEIMNCGNTGTIEAVGEGTSTNKLSRWSRSYVVTDVEKDWLNRTHTKERAYVRRYLNAGGLVGLSTSVGHVDMYTSYNSGNIQAWGNNAGGLIGSDIEYTKLGGSNRQTTKIYYCYNTGGVTTGADKYIVFHGYNDDNTDKYDNDVDTSKAYTEHHAYLVDKGNDEVNIDDREDGGTVQKVDHRQMSLRHETRVEGGKRREGGSFGSTVGGIIGATTNTDVNYCYNLGTITCRGIAIYTVGSGYSGVSYTEYHARAGGIVGLVDSGSVSVSNSYSVGDIKVEARHAVTGTFSVSDTLTVLKEFKQQRPMYVAGIVGHDNANEEVDVNNCFSLKWQCHFLDENNKWFRYHIEGYNDIVTGIIKDQSTGEWYGTTDILRNWYDGKIKNAKMSLGTLLPSEDENSSSGYVVEDVSQLTAIVGANGIVTMTSGKSYSQANPKKLNTTETTTHTVRSATYLNSVYNEKYKDYTYDGGSEGSVDTLLNVYSDIKNASYGGWIFMPGCLPQLAVFALDTQDGLAMTSIGYGQNTQGEYVQEPAGSEFNPYVIKDGIDLLGLSALVTGGAGGKYVDFDGKYIEFANGTNNLSGVKTTSIQMPVYSANFNKDGKTRDYIFRDGNTVKEGKSYQLYNRAANGLHGVKGASNETSQTAIYPATSIRATVQDPSSQAFNTDKLDSAYTIWTKNHYGFNGTAYATSVLFNLHNFNPIGYRGTISEDGETSHAFKGNISGLLPDGSQTQILDLKVRGGYVAVNDSEEKDSYAGLFGLADDATISNITVAGNVTAYNNQNGTAQAGIVAKAYGDTKIIGLSAGTSKQELVIKTATGDKGYTGGIVGSADSGESGNRLTIENCVVTYADISTHNISRLTNREDIGTGGIVGFTKGENASSFTDIVDCNVVRAYIHSALGYAVAGVVGNQGTNGAVAVEGCTVGTDEATYSEADGKCDTCGKDEAECTCETFVDVKNPSNKPTGGVKIEGNVAIGGIVSYAFASATCTNSFIDCYVYDDVLIKRLEGGNNIDNVYGTAIGGIVGAILDDENGQATFSGFISFFGTIDLSAHTNNVNVGGVVGYMGSSTYMEQCVIEIGGTIEAGAIGDGENVGGFAGISKGVILDGVFLIHPTMNVATFDSVGGFIGYNAGDTNVARTAIIYTTPAEWEDKNGDDVATRDEIVPQINDKVGSIVANEDVGGFIGSNEAGRDIVLGTSIYKGKIYGREGDYAVIVLGSTVDGKKHIGGFVGHNAGDIQGVTCQVTNAGHVGANVGSVGTNLTDDSTQYIGGVVGINDFGGTITISNKSSIVNSGQVGHSDFKTSYQEYVGGIIGASFGTISVEGKEDPINPESTEGILANIGSVYGYRYVGGAIGVVGAGTISGSLNNGTDTDTNAVSSSYESEAMVADGEVSEGETEQSGTGAEVHAVQNVGGVIGVVMQDAIIDSATMSNYGLVVADSEGVEGVNYVSNLGGVIGLHYGIIRNTSTFYNYGAITAENFAGGAIGVSDGTIDSSEFINYAGITFLGDTALGGSVGYITKGYSDYYPGGISAYTANKNPSTVCDSYFSYEPVTGAGYDKQKVVVQATGARAHESGEISGGLGGVFGVIDSTDIKLDNNNNPNWTGNKFFINGDVFGGTFKEGTTFTHSNFVGTVENVGGVVGIISGAYITIENMLVYISNVGGKDNVGGIIGSNGSTNTTSDKTASIYNCYNVYGEVIASASGAVAGGIVGNVVATDGNNPLTYASYWIKKYANQHLQNSNPDDIAGTLDKASSWTTFLSYKNYASNNDIGDKSEDEITDADLEAEGVTTIEEYLNKTGYLTSDCATWDAYFTANPEYTQNANGDWGTYGDVDVKYNTGTEATGYYYIFAEDGALYAGEGKDIVVDHTGKNGKLDEPYSDETLNFWLIIANSPKQDVKSYASNNVHTKANDGNVIPGYIYSTAYTATANGYYLYVKSTDQEATKMYADGKKMYVSSNAEYANNVMIFYKEYTSGTDLQYNGFYRWATASEDLIQNDEQSKDSTDVNGEAVVEGKTYVTFTGTDRANGINEGKLVGDYHTKATIWALDSNDELVVLGSVDSTDESLADRKDSNGNINYFGQYKWTIKKKEVTVELGETYHIDIPEFDNDNLYTGQYSHYVSVLAKGIALDEPYAHLGVNEESVVNQLKKIVKVQYSIRNKVSNQKVDATFDMTAVWDNKDLIAPEPSEADVYIVAYCRALNGSSIASPVVNNKHVDTHTIDDTTVAGANLSQSTYYNIEFRVYAKKAGTYEISAIAEDGNHTTKKQGKTILQIDRRDMKLSYEVSDGGTFKDSYVFDGGVEYRGVQSVTITNISATDLTAIGNDISKMFGIELNLGKDNVATARTEHYKVTKNPSSVKIEFFTSDVGTYNPVIYLTEDGYADSYKLVHATKSVGSITPQGEAAGLTKWEAEWAISPFSINVGTVKVSSKEVVYNGQTHSVKYEAVDGGSFDDKVPLGNEVVRVAVNISTGEGLAEQVNVGVYPVTVVTIGADKFVGTVTRDGSVAMSVNKIENYQLDGDVLADDNVSLTIKEREIRVSWNGTLTSSYVYDGQTHGLSVGDVKFEMKNDSGDWEKVGTATLTNDTISFAGLLQHEKPLGGTVSETLNFTVSGFTATNAGTYTATIGDSIKSIEGNNDAGRALASNYRLVSTPSGHQYEIEQRQIRLEWNTNPAPITSFVYQGYAQGLGADAVVFKMNEGGSWVTAGTLTISGNTLTVSGVLGAETLTFSIDEFTATNAGNYTAKIKNFVSATGTNAEGDTSKNNYDYDDSDVKDGKAYNIDQSIIRIIASSQLVAGKEFDNTSTVKASLPSFTLESVNNGAIACTVTPATKDYWKNDTYGKDAGKGYSVRVTFNVNDSKNYVLEDNLLILDAKAEITPKGVTVILNTNKGNTAQKQFDNNNIYATATAGDDGEAKSTGVEFRPGRGITVTGFVKNDGGTVITAVFEEIDRNRVEFDEYVNGVYKDSNGYHEGGAYYKQLRITLSGDGYQNYYIASVQARSGSVIAKQLSGTSIVVKDSRADDDATLIETFYVNITKYSIKATYGNTVQSYANPDNTYNTDWKDVYCSQNKIPSSWGFTDKNLTIKVNNGWQTANGGKYTKYTRIVGRLNSSTLGAYLESDAGYNFCVNLRTQPTLIIGYFVEKPDGNAIGTMAGLLIASEYYKGNFDPTGTMSYNYVQTAVPVPDGTTWEEYLNENPDYDITTHSLYQSLLAQYDPDGSGVWNDALASMLGSFELVYEQLDGQTSPTLQYVYWQAQEVVDEQQYKVFYLIDNIDGILTESDMEILTEAFGSNWGVGTNYLSNVVFAEVGSAVILNGSVFDYVDGKGFDGYFNGNGYVIDHLTITKTITQDGTYNVGMFSEIVANTTDEDITAMVTALGFRNLSIYVTDNTTGGNTIINVGAVAGKYAGSVVMTDITVHGTIYVKSKTGTVSVGGVLGYDTTGYVDGGVSSVLERAMLVATIRGEGNVAYVGGIVGVMSKHQTSMTDLVSLSEVYAKGTTAVANGFVGRYMGNNGGSVEMKSGADYETAIINGNAELKHLNSTAGKQSAYMDAVFTISVEGVYAKVTATSCAKSYTELYDGSNTAFDNAGKYTTPATTNNYGVYDVVNEKDVNTMAEAELSKTTGTMRLKDIVDIYVLGYGLIKASATVNSVEVETYQKLDTSKYFHASNAPVESGYKPDGTSDNPIKIAYQQHLSLLRMFNYMNFEITKDINMYTGYNLALVDEAFTGTVDAKGKKVNVISADKKSGTVATMFAYQQPLAFDWLVVVG